jgi:membrane-bound serine protease (ClpP class)
MHGWLALLSAILVAIGALLILGAIYGVTNYGLDVQMTISVALVLLIIAGVAASISYAGFKAQNRRVKTGIEALMGAKGVVVIELAPKGEIRVSGELWQALSKNAPINKGKTVEIVGIEKMFLIVKPTEEKA